MKILFSPFFCRTFSVGVFFFLFLVMGYTQNDNGTPVTPTKFNWNMPMSTAAFSGCPPTDPVMGTFSGTNVQTGRIFRDGTQSVCPSKVYPGIFNAAIMYNYETYTYSNTSNASSCVTINFDPNMGGTPCAGNAHASAYIGSYDPTNQATNYVGDVGSSLAQPFSFDVPANSDVVLVITNTGGGGPNTQICDFAFQVVGLPCIVPPIAATAPIPTMSQWGLMIFGLVIMNLGVFFIQRRVLI